TPRKQPLLDNKPGVLDIGNRPNHQCLCGLRGLFRVDYVSSGRNCRTREHYPQEGKVGRQPYPVETMLLRIHFMQQWFNLSDPATEEALYDIFSMRRFAKLPGGRAPDERRF